jgi:hypothetical protein
MRISKKQSVRMKRNANRDEVTPATGTPQESRIWREHFKIEDIGQWDVRTVAHREKMFEGAVSDEGVRWR